jgi:hypothetical protein
MTLVTSASSQDTTKHDDGIRCSNLQNRTILVRAKLPNEKSTCMIYLKILGIHTFVATVCLAITIGMTNCTPPVETLLLFQEASRSFVEDGMQDMVSNAKSSNPPLSKELFLQTQGQANDYWEGR